MALFQNLNKFAVSNYFLQCHTIQDLNIFQMKAKILFLTLAILFIEACTISLTQHEAYSDTCFYLPIGSLFTTKEFNYTITQAWTAEQSAQLKSGALNTSDFIHVGGWKPYRHPNRMFQAVTKNLGDVQHKLTFVKDVLQGSDAPEFGLSTPDLQLAYGNPSLATEYKVPSGKALIALRFQATVPANPYLGKWSIIIDQVNIEDLEIKLKAAVRKVKKAISDDHTTPFEITSALNIVPAFIENSLFWTFTTSPAQGTVGLVDYQGFVVAIREGESVLTGPIEGGQPKLIQLKDVVKSRTSCV